jgi:hypothetical protein
MTLCLLFSAFNAAKFNIFKFLAPIAPMFYAKTHTCILQTYYRLLTLPPLLLLNNDSAAGPLFQQTSRSLRPSTSSGYRLHLKVGACPEMPPFPDIPLVSFLFGDDCRVGGPEGQAAVAAFIGRQVPGREIARCLAGIWDPRELEVWALSSRGKAIELDLALFKGILPLPADSQPVSPYPQPYMAVSRLYARKGAPLAFPQLPCLQIQGGPVHGGTVGVDHLDFYPLEVVSLRPLFPGAQRRIMQMSGRWAPEINCGLGSSRQPPNSDPPPTAAVVASVASGSNATCPSFRGSPLPWHVAAQNSASRHS